MCSPPEACTRSMPRCHDSDTDLPMLSSAFAVSKACVVASSSASGTPKRPTTSSPTNW